MVQFVLFISPTHFTQLNEMMILQLEKEKKSSLCLVLDKFYEKYEEKKIEMKNKKKTKSYKK